MASIGELVGKIEIDTRDVKRASNEVQKHISQMEGSIGNLSNKFHAGIGQMRGAVAGFGTILAGAGAGLLGYGTSVAMSMETMGVALETSFGGNIELAKQAQASIVEFAKKTPYELKEVMSSFIKLKNYGLDPSEEALRSYGDTASAMGKSLENMIEAVADASTGEFERLKEFGIKSAVEGDKVKFTFQGVTTEVGKNAEEIERYLINLGKTKFAGGMQAQSKTLSGMISTLKDEIGLTLSELVQEFGLFEGAKNFVKNLTDFVSRNKQDVIKFFKEIQKTVSDFFETMSENQTVRDILTFLQDFFTKNQKHVGEFLVVFGALTSAMLVFAGTTALIANPVTLVIGVLALLSAAVVFLKKVWDENMWGVKDTLTNIYNGYIVPTFNALNNFLTVQIPQAIQVLVNFWNAYLLPIFQALKWAWDNIGFQVVRFMVEVFGSGLRLAIQGFVNFWNSYFLPIFQALKTQYDSYIKPFVDNFQKKIEELKPVLSGVASFMADIFKSAINGMIDAVNRGLSAMNVLIRQAKKVPGVNISEFSSIPRLETGTHYHRGGLALVGEKGAELVSLPAGARVYNAPETRGIMGQNGGGGSVNINLNISGVANPQVVADLVIRKIKNITANDNLNASLGFMPGL